MGGNRHDGSSATRVEQLKRIEHVVEDRDERVLIVRREVDDPDLVGIDQKD